MQGEYKSFDLIAIHAGLAAGMEHLPTVAEASIKLSRVQRKALVAKVADNPKAVEIRDELFIDFERRLRDSGYGGDKIWQWFQKTYGPIARSSIYRPRAEYRAQNSRIQEIATEARAYMELAAEEGADGIFDAATLQAGQIYFQLLMSLTGEDLKGIKADPKKIIQLIDSLGALQRSRAQTDLLKQKVAEMTQKFDQQIAKAQARSKRGDGSITPEMLQKIRKTVFGSNA